MVALRTSPNEVWTWLHDIADPEIPALSIVDLGIVRDVRWSPDDHELIVTITPTYSGCPAMEVIASDIRASIHAHGIERTRIETKLSPAWTTDWMSDEAKEKLHAYGIAPPSRIVNIEGIHVTNDVVCPHCGSQQTELVSRYGSTPCKALYKCRSCLEPFDAFKRH